MFVDILIFSEDNLKMKWGWKNQLKAKMNDGMKVSKKKKF